MRRVFGLALVMGLLISATGFAQLRVRNTTGTTVMSVDQDGHADLLGRLSADSLQIKLSTSSAGMVPFSMDDRGVLIWSLAPSSDGQVLKWNATTDQWEPAADDGGTTYSADETTLHLDGTTFSAFNNDAQWNADRLQGNDITTDTPSSGQVLKWNGSAWAPAADDGGTTYSADETTLHLDGGTFSAFNDDAQWNADRLQGNGITTDTPSSGQVLKWNGSAWAPAADDGGTSYSADETTLHLDGTTFSAFNNDAQWNANRLQDRTVSSTAPSNNQILKWNNSTSEWQPATDANTTYSGGTGITIDGSNNINAQASTAMWNADALQTNPVSSTAPSSGQVLKWNGSSWAPGADDGGTTYTGGTGITISGGSEINADAATAMWNADALQGNDISTSSPSNNQVLKWNGSAWAPAADVNTTYTAGTGLTLSGNEFNAQASTAMWNADELQGNSVSATAPGNNEVLKWNGSAWTPQSDQTGASFWNGTSGTATTIDRSGSIRVGGSSAGSSLQFSYSSGEATIESGSGNNPLYIKGDEVIIVIP